MEVWSSIELLYCHNKCKHHNPLWALREIFGFPQLQFQVGHIVEQVSMHYVTIVGNHGKYLSCKEISNTYVRLID